MEERGRRGLIERGGGVLSSSKKGGLNRGFRVNVFCKGNICLRLKHF